MKNYTITIAREDGIQVTRKYNEKFFRDESDQELAWIGSEIIDLFKQVKNGTDEIPF